MLQSVGRESTGEYRCEVENSEGVTSSNSVPLVVSCKCHRINPIELQIITNKLGFLADGPVCVKGSEVVVVRAQKYEKISLQCRVESSPKVNSFTWKLSATGDDFAARKLSPDEVS